MQVDGRIRLARSTRPGVCSGKWRVLQAVAAQINQDLAFQAGSLVAFAVAQAAGSKMHHEACLRILHARATRLKSPSSTLALEERKI